jgi:hypothetical protein
MTRLPIEVWVADSNYNQRMARTERKSLSKLLTIPALTVVVSMSLISTDSFTQDENETCPCFSYEEVESIFLSGKKLAEAGGSSSCSAEDYNVEISAEVIVWDQDFATIAQVSVKWYDFDPSRCEYLDSTGNPGVERNVTWPHPAPEATARACFNIISRVIAKSDTSGVCTTHP